MTTQEGPCRSIPEKSPLRVMRVHESRQQPRPSLESFKRLTQSQPTLARLALSKKAQDQWSHVSLPTAAAALPRLALPTPDRERLAAHSCTSWRWSDELLLILAHVFLALALLLAELARALRHRAHTTHRRHSPCGRGPLQQAPRVSIRVSKKEHKSVARMLQELQVEKCRCAARVLLLALL